MENDLNQNNAPVVQNPNQAVMSMGQWIVTILVTTIIPCVNIIMLFVWGFGNGNENRKNYCRAMLIVMAISIVPVSYTHLSACRSRSDKKYPHLKHRPGRRSPDGPRF